MEPANIDALVKRLVDDPHDQEALALAHEAGSSDPRSFAMLLERVGTMTDDAGYASHWLSQAAQVWSVTVGDAHRAARVLMQAIDRDPTQRAASDSLAELYREKGDTKGLIALQERRVKVLTPLLGSGEDVREELLAIHGELAQLWAGTQSQPKKALTHYKRVSELDPSSALAIYNLRETMKELGQVDEALPLYAAEVAVETDPERKVALLRDEAFVRKSMGDLAGASRALGKARLIDANNSELQYEFASTVVEQVAQGEETSPAVRAAAVELLVGLAEQFDGEHGIAYASAALDITPGHDRALELLNYYARALGRESELPARQSAYLQAAPEGGIAADVRMQLADHFEQSGDYQGAASVLEPLLPAGHESVSQRVSSLRQLVAEKQVSVDSSKSTVTAHPVASAVDIGSDAEEIVEEEEAAAEQEADDESRPSASDVTFVPHAGSQETPSAAIVPSPAGPGSKATFVVTDTIGVLVDEAKTLAAAGESAQALIAMRQVLRTAPSHREALAWTCDRMEELGQFTELCDVLRDALNATPRTDETRDERKAQLERLASVASRKLHDDSAALAAYDELLDLDARDAAAAKARDELLAEAGRWADLVESLEGRRDEPGSDPIALGERLADIHGEKLHDEKARALELDRLSRKEPTLARVQKAATSFEAAGDVASAIACVGESLHSAAKEDLPALLQLCGDLYQKSQNPLRAAESYRDAGVQGRDVAVLEKAEACAVSAENFTLAADIASRIRDLTDGVGKAACLVRESGYLDKGGNSEQSLALLERAYELTPDDKALSLALTAKYESLGLWNALAKLYAARAERAPDADEKLDLLRKAASIYGEKVGDNDECRKLQLAIVATKEDEAAAKWLLDDATARHDNDAIARELDRLLSMAKTKEAKVAIALRQAAHASDALEDSDVAVARYEFILKEIDPACRPALRALAAIQEARGDILDAASAVLRELSLADTDADRTALATKLARLGEQSGDLDVTVTALEHLAKADPDDFDVLDRLCTAYETAERWDGLAEALPKRIEAEADEEEISALTLKLAKIKHEHQANLDGALDILLTAGKNGDKAARARFIELATETGRENLVPPAILAFWLPEKPSPERAKWLRMAFDKDAEKGTINLPLAVELLRTRNPDRSLAEKVERLALESKDETVVSIVEEALARTFRGFDHSKELLRQSQARVTAGCASSGAIAHAEAGLASVPPSEIGGFLESVANLSTDGAERRGVYQRFAEKARSVADRTRAFIGAASIAAEDGDTAGVATALKGALTPPWTSELLDGIESAVRDSKEGAVRKTLTTGFLDAVLAAAEANPEMATAQASLYRRAATVALSELGDKTRGLNLLSKAVHAHADNAVLDTLTELAADAGTAKAVEAILTEVLEAKSHPAARAILEHRGRLRRDRLLDFTGATADLKRAHELSPNDVGIIDQLSTLLENAGDSRALVHLLEEQMLRSKDQQVRADLARRIARLWDAQIGDAREAADGWRRVLRMAPGDAEATEGLDRSKMTIRRTSEAAVRAALPPSTPDLTSVLIQTAKQTSAVTPQELAAPAPPHEQPAEAMEQKPADPSRSSGTIAAAVSTSVTDESPVTELASITTETPVVTALHEASAETSPSPHATITDEAETEARLASAAAESLTTTQEEEPSAVENPHEEPVSGEQLQTPTEPPRASATQQQTALALDAEPDLPPEGPATEDDVVIADELAEMIDDESHRDVSAAAEAVEAHDKEIPPTKQPDSDRPPTSPSAVMRAAKSGPPPLPQS